MVGVLENSTLPLGPAASAAAHNRFSFGGVSRNVAENLSRLGQSVRLITAVGDDPLGHQLLAGTAACGVDVSGSLVAEGKNTASYLAIYDTRGECISALEDMRVLSEITPAFIKERATAFEGVGMVFIDANLSPEALDTVFQMAQQAQLRVCADTASSILAERLLPHLERLTLLTANSAEASMLTHHQPEVTGRSSAQLAARQLLNQGMQLVVLAIGSHGVCYASSETSGHVPAVRTQVIDPVGAGDALTAAVIFGLLNDISIDEAVRLGVSAASLTLRHPGTVFPELTLQRLYDELVI